MKYNIEGLDHQNSNNFLLLAGPCAVESELTTLRVAEKVKALSDKYSIPYVFKASYRKANRSRLDSFSGIGDEEAITILKKVKSEFGLPIVTDIHETQEAAMAAEFADILQIPAFLCRQTNLLVAAAETGKTVNIKKGQFLSADAMKFSVEKIIQSGNNNVMVTERGNSFGYSDLIVDFTNIPRLKALGVPVILDITHSLQKPNQASGVTGGDPSMIETIAKAGIANNVDGIFIETHPNPAEALSDGANMLQLDLLESLLVKLLRVQDAVK
ncbi:MAG: 3-deoxy-8-phosphooctulonate synthase [Flavobacteriales bacterium]|nr:3-deoxy-8-phosphooctulonate synthase [Flavobacteriales bacterium]